jgi:hypothetical protein
MIHLQKQIRTAIVIVFAIFVATGCKKDVIQPNLVEELNNKKWKVEEMSVENADFQRYFIDDFDYYAPNPTTFQIKIGSDASSAQKSLLYKSEITWQMKNFVITTAGENAINIFSPENGTFQEPLNGNMPQVFIANEIFQVYTTSCYPNPCQYYSYTTHVLDGYYKITKEYDRYTLTRTTPMPEIKIVLSNK